MLQRNKEPGTIKILEDFLNQKTSASEQPIKPAKKEKIKEKSDMKSQAAKKLQGYDNLNKSYNPGKSIISAGAGLQSDFGGPAKQMKVPSSNSIFEPDRMQKMEGKESSKQTTQREKKEKNAWRNDVKKERLDQMIESLRLTDQRKDSTVQNTSTESSPSHRASPNNISIFDDEPFESLPEMTDGEKVAQEARKQKKPDDSWHGVKGDHRASHTVNKLFDKLIGDDSE